MQFMILSLDIYETSPYMADVRISIGCFRSQRLKTLKQIMPTSIGSWLRNAAFRSPKTLFETR